MLFVDALSEIEISTLDELRTHHPLPTVRVRAHGIILSGKGYKVQEIADILDVCRQSVSTWIMNWDSDGICGLLDKPRSGRPKEIEIDENSLIEKIKESPRSLKKIIAELKEELNIDISISYLKKLCKKSDPCVRPMGVMWNLLTSRTVLLQCGCRAHAGAAPCLR